MALDRLKAVAESFVRAEFSRLRFQSKVGAILCGIAVPAIGIYVLSLGVRMRQGQAASDLGPVGRPMLEHVSLLLMLVAVIMIGCGAYLFIDVVRTIRADMRRSGEDP